MNEQFSIAGKVAVITGAGGVLGGSIAKCFMEQGAKVVAVDIRQEQLDKRVEELKAYGEDVIGIVGNVLDIASLEKLAYRHPAQHCRWQYAGCYAGSRPELLRHGRYLLGKSD